MTKGQKAGAVRRKRAAGNTGPKPNVATFVKTLKKVVKGLEKASKTHAKQAKIVKKHIKKMGRHAKKR